MRDEIRKRINAVRRGEVPEGYIVENHQLRPLDWKYEKIGKYLVAHDEYSNDTERYMLATSSRQGLLPQTDYYNDQRFEETTGGFHVVPEGYVTYRHMSDDDVFKFNVNDLGAPVLVSPEYPVFTTNAELNQSLLIEYLNGTNEFRSFCRAQKKGSTRTRMYFGRLGEFMMPIPPISEQQKIADILSACDRLIALKQNCLEELKQLKKTCLAKMFPREGEDVPELRFPGFTAPWEQRKLGSIFRTIGNAFVGTATPYYVEDGHFYLESNNIKDGQINRNVEVFINDEFYEKQKDKWLRTGDLVMVQSGHVGHSAVIPEELDKTAAHALIMFKNQVGKYDPYFLSFQFQTTKAKMKIENITMGNTVKHILASDMQEFAVDVPSFDEQASISRLFLQLDNLIALYQRELEAEQQKKKALMQLLLTGLVRVPD